jgi:hypothetical protein
LHARQAGRVNAPVYNDTPDRETGFLNPQGMMSNGWRRI